MASSNYFDDWSAECFLLYESISSTTTTFIATVASVACFLYSGKYGCVVSDAIRAAYDFDSHREGNLFHHSGDRMICARLTKKNEEGIRIHENHESQLERPAYGPRFESE